MKPLVFSPDAVHMGNLILVNGQHPYLEGNNRKTLVPVGLTHDKVFLDRRATVLLNRLMSELDGWAQILPVSGWRSEQEQQAIFDQSLRDNGPDFTGRYVAKPGHSEHQTGLAIDLGLRAAKIDFIRPNFPDTGICSVFREKAAAFGFIERYPKGKEAITGIAHEPWHFRYVGAPHAAMITALGLSLEEYHTYLKQYPHPQKYQTYRNGEQTIRISHVKASRGTDTVVEVDAALPYSVSGNNMDGFILAEWRQSHDEC